MKYNLDKVMVGLDKTELKRQEGEGLVPWTMSQAIAAALCGQPERTLTPAESVVRYHLAMKLMDGGEVELSAESVVQIKEAVARNYAPIISGQVIALLERENG